MKVSLHISGLLFVIAGLIFLLSALLSKRIYLYAAAVVCCVCGLLLMLSRRKPTGHGRYLDSQK